MKRYQVLPTTGMEGGTEWRTAIRDEEMILVCEVVSYESSEDSRQKAFEIVEALYIAHEAKNLCYAQCQDDRHAPNCLLKGHENKGGLLW
ncbi:MAG: hypothetical protein D6726_07915 [Nitrospirae bacterium]|nr:MAG: hypothetical protein D6726_07915 [Nitrospirota bacterium]